MRRLLVDCPGSAEILVEYGMALYCERARAAAAIAFSRAAIVAPHIPEAHYDLALVLMDLGRPEEAVAEYLLALAGRQDYPEAWCNLGNALMAVGKRAQAVVAYRQATFFRRDFAEAWNNLGLALQEMGLAAAAVGAFRAATVLAPAFAAGHHNLATLLKDFKKLSAALASHQRAVICDPDMLEARAALAHQRRHACDWPGLAEEEEQILEAVRQGGRVAPMILLAMASTPADQLLCAGNWLAAVDEAAVGRQFRAWPRLASVPVDGRLRIGYLSADFHAHATAYLAAEVFECHDRDKFEIFAYSYGPDDGSAMRRRLLAAFDGFLDLRVAGCGDIAARIHADGIDVLVDLKGHTQHARPEILALRPAPVQIGWLGYPGTTGAKFIDWAIVDRMVVPSGEAEFFSERLLRLPNSYQPNDSRRSIGKTPRRDACGLPEKGFVFCAFNSAFKLGPEFFGVWMALLRQVPGSVLWLLEAPSPMPENLRREAQAHGVDPDRLVFAPKLAQEQHLARHRLADLFLDVLPYGAHTTASDALWAGLPVLTVCGTAFAGRVAASLLSALDLPELVMPSLSAYKEKALALARQPAELAALRRKLSENRMTAPLFDGRQFARDLEAAYRQLWVSRRTGADHV